MSNKTIRAGIMIDSWKLPVFKKRLKKAGYSFEKGDGVVPGTLSLYVETNNTIKLQKVVEEANRECARSKMH